MASYIQQGNVLCGVMQVFEAMLESFWNRLKKVGIRNRQPSVDEVRRKYERRPTLREQRELDMMYKLRRYRGM